jgi:hypothetical protein
MPVEAIQSRSGKGIMVLVLAIVCFISARTHADPDLWGHVRFGQDLLAAGVSMTDSYSYVTGDQPWINHELLAEILFAAAFKALGVPGLVMLKVGLVLITVGPLYRRLLNQRLHPLRAGIVIVVVLMLMSVGLWTIRPHLFTYLFFLLTLLLIDAAERGSRRALWVLPVVMFVWANSHGGFLAGLGVVGVWATVHGVLRRWPRASKESQTPGWASLAVLVAACVGATLLNPYGVTLLSFLFRTGTVARPEIGEWQPIWIGSPEGIAYVVALGVSIVALVATKRMRKPALLAVFFVTALLPLIALRHVPLFALSFGVLIGEHLTDVWNRWSAERSSQRALPAVAEWAVALAFLVAAIPQFQCIQIDPSFVRFPARAVGLMSKSGVRGNVATFFDWGEYIIWHLGPDVRVSIDGRRETVYSPESYAKSLRFLYGIGEWDTIVDDPRTDMALVGRDQPTYNLMQLKTGWTLIYQDSVSALFARLDSPQANTLRGAIAPDLPPDGTGLCFP